MPEYKFDTSGNIEDHITELKKPSLLGGTITEPKEIIMPTAEETAARHAQEAKEQAENEARIGQIIESGVPVLRPMPDLLTTPSITGNLNQPAWDIYRNMTNPDAKALYNARKYADALGVSQQYLVDNPEMMKRAEEIYNKEKAHAFMGNYTFSPRRLDSLYPELEQMRKADPVGASIALKHHESIKSSRSIFDYFMEAGDLFADAFNSGSDMVKLYDAQMKAYHTGDVEAARPAVEAISKRLQEYQERSEPDSFLGKIVYSTIQQLTLYGTQGLRALQYVPKNMALAMTMAAPAAAAVGGATAGTGAAATLTAAGVTGVVWGMREGMFREIQNQSMAERYWEMANTKDTSGKTVYTRRNMLIDSTLVGTANAAIEMGLLELGYGPIKAAYGTKTAQKILKDGAVQKSIVNQGKAALLRMAAVGAGAQYLRSVTSELVEEGTQSLVGDVANNIEYALLGGRGGEFRSTRDVLNNAIDSMVEAVPAALGMGGMGAGLHGVGRYTTMSRIASIKAANWRQEYQRNVEQQVVDQIVENKTTNTLAKEAPDVYANVVQAQADKSGMGTIYVDAQELATSEEGVNVLNDVVKRGMATAEQVDTAVENGTNLEIGMGVFAQQVDESFDRKTLMEVSSLEKDGLHVKALRERAKRMESVSKELSDIAQNKSDRLANEIMEDQFADADDMTQTAAQSVVYRNPFDLVTSYKEALKEARQQYEAAVNFDYYWKYEPSGTSILVSDADGHDNVQTGRGIRVSENEPWYSDMYKEYGKKATREQMLDVAYRNERKQMAAFNPEEVESWDEQAQGAKKLYETLRDMKDTFAELAKSDYALRKSFSKDGAIVYANAVNLMSHGSPALRQAAKENAYIYARMAETWAKLRRDWGDTAYTAQDYAAAHPIHVGGVGTIKKTVQFGQPITNLDVNLDEAAPVITIQEKYAGMDWRDLRRKLPGTIEEDIVTLRNKNGEYINPYVHEASGRQVIVTKNGSLSHFKSADVRDKEESKKRKNTLHYEIIEAVPEIIKRGIWVEEHTDNDGTAQSISRIIAAVNIDGNIYGVKVLINKERDKYYVDGGEYTQFRAYDVSTAKNEPLLGGTSSTHVPNETADHWPSQDNDSSYTFSIRELLKHVNDNVGHPYINSDGTPNYGIYFGKGKKGGYILVDKNGAFLTQMAGPHSQTAAVDALAEAKQRITAGEDKQKVFEQRTRRVRGAYDVSSRILHLFDEADQSTFIHEAAHMWLSDVEAFAMQDDAPQQLIKDLQTIRDWASYQPEQLKEYMGSNREKEFTQYAKDIEAARQSGDTVAIKEAEERWIQERFARGFERYVAEGKAPSQTLQGPFRKFKKWLIAIYRDLTNLGKEPPEDVKRVMDRMVATDEEIEVWAKTKELNAWERTGFSGDLSGPEGEKIRKWSDRIKEEAKEKLLADKIAELRQQEKADLAEGWEQEKMSKQKELVEEDPIYAYETIWNKSPETRPAILEKLDLKDEKAFKNAIQEAGGPLEERLNAYMEEAKVAFEPKSDETIRQEADEWLAGTNGQLALNELEAHAMRRKLNRYIAECVKALRELGNIKGTDEEIAAQLRNVLGIDSMADKEAAKKGSVRNAILSRNAEIKELKDKLTETKSRSKAKIEEAEDVYKRKAADAKARSEAKIEEAKDSIYAEKIKRQAEKAKAQQREQELKKLVNKERERNRDLRKENAQNIKILKDGLHEVMQGLHAARDMTAGSYMEMLRAARSELEDRNVSDAISWRHFEMKAAAANRRADQYMSAGKFELAVAEKGNAQKFLCLSRAAKDNKDFVRKVMQGESGRLDENGEPVDGMYGILKRLRRTKNPVRMNPHARYFMQHLAYNLGIEDRDGILPLDKDGNSVPLDWDKVYSLLSPDYAVDKSVPVNDIVAPWVRAIVDGKERKQYETIQMIQFRDVNNVIRAMYKVGRSDYEGHSIMNEDGKAISTADAVAELVQTMEHDEHYNPEQEKNNQTRWQRQKETLSDGILALTKPEIILQNLGKTVEDGKKWLQYIYRPLDKASVRELEMQTKAMREFASIHKMYSWQEWRVIRNAKDYSFGGVDKYTKEQIIAMALNWGNTEGRQRIIDEVKKNMKINDDHVARATIEDRFAEYLTNKDLDFMEAVWKQIGQYWPERNKVQERLYGVGMGRVPARSFVINGRTVSGGYYPIVYDRDLSNRTNELALDDIARTMMAGNAAMAVGMGSTKKRAAKVTNQTVAKTLDIWPSAVNEAIHHITMREAVTEVYRLISHPDIEAIIQENNGMHTYQTLKDWVRDCWKTEVQKQDKLTRYLEKMRRNTSFAIMGYRTSTALLNATNIFPMMKALGPVKTMEALYGFGFGFGKGSALYNQNRQFVMDHSPFMAERMNTLDKDLQQRMQFTISDNDTWYTAKAKVMRNAANQYAYWFVQETDLMLSMAMWKRKYDDTMRQQITDGKTDESVMRDNAAFAADKAVRDVLGSGMTKDQAAIQRQNGLAAQLAPFYSYSSTVMNALIDAGYKWKKGNKAALFNAMLFWILLPTIGETLIRSAIGGEDDPEKILKKMSVGVLKSTAQGIPVVRDTVEMVGNYLFDLPNYGGGSSVLAVSILEELGKTGAAVMSDKKDATDVARSATRAVNRYVGFSDTLTDGFWALMRFSLVDTDRSFIELASSIFFDRRYRTAKERLAAEKKKANAKKKEDKK